MQDGALLNNLKNIDKPIISDIPSRHSLPTMVITKIAAMHLKSKMQWFAEQKEISKRCNEDFRTDQLCILVLAYFTIMDVTQNFKHLLIYKQLTVCRSRWITTASGYLRFLVYYHYKLSATEMSNLINIVSVYVSSFSMIHLKPKQCD